MDITYDLIYKDVELVHEFDKETYEEGRKVIRFSFVFSLSHSKTQDEWEWDEKYELRTVAGVHVYCEGTCWARDAEVTVKLSTSINCDAESKKVYVETLKEAFNGQIPKKVCVITNLDQEPVAMGNIETNQFMYIQGKPRLVSKKHVIEGILSYIRVE